MEENNIEVTPEVNPLEEKIAELEQKNTDLNDKLLRALAELDNVRRRSREEVEKTARFAISSFATDLVVVAENFFMASENAPKEEIEKNPAIKNYADAIVMTEKELLKILEKKSGKKEFIHLISNSITIFTKPLCISNLRPKREWLCKLFSLDIRLLIA